MAAPSPEREQSSREDEEQLVSVLNALQGVEARLDGLLHRASAALDAHEKACARPADPLDLIQYARELSASTAARPGWDGRAHVMPQHYFAPTFEMLLNPNAWMQVAARAAREQARAEPGAEVRAPGVQRE